MMLGQVVSPWGSVVLPVILLMSWSAGRGEGGCDIQAC